MSARVVLQNYTFDRFLERLSKSEYRISLLDQNIPLNYSSARFIICFIKRIIKGKRVK